MPPAPTDDAAATDASPTSGALAVLGSRPVLAALAVAACAVLLELTPALARFRLFGKRPAAEAVVATAPAPSATVGESTLGLETKAPGAAPGATELAPAAASEARALEQAPPVPLLDPSGHALDGFFAALRRGVIRESSTCDPNRTSCAPELSETSRVRLTRTGEA